jgi:teichuronic acid exporter
LNTLKEKAINGMMWSFAERFGYLLLQFTTNIVLARLLTPTDFGLIGMLLVFVALSLTLIDGGFGAALIQKKEPSSIDYSTVFILNIVLAIIFYTSLVLFSNNIAIFYDQPQLSILLKYIGVILIIDSFGIIQINKLMKEVNFKLIAKVKITSAFISCSVAIIFALFGYGVWSLIIQYILNSSIRTSLFWIGSNWRPSIIFSRESFNELFGYGSKIFAARFISELYIHIQSLVIGRVYSSADLGFFTQAKQLQQIPVSSLATVVNNVTFPVYSELQNDNLKLISGVRKSLRTVAFINFPLMILLTVISHPLILFLFSEKWLESVPYFQILCSGFGMLLIVHSVNINVLKSIGLSNWVLKLEILKKVIGVILIIIGIKYYGIIGILFAITLNSYVEFILNGFITGKVIGYGIKLQLKDLLPSFTLSILVGIICYALSSLMYISIPLMEVMIVSIIYIIIYTITAYIFKFDSMYEILSIIKVKINI